jgi:hypothetical protein
MEINPNHQSSLANYLGRIHRPTAGLTAQIKNLVTLVQEMAFLLNFLKLINGAGRVTFFLGPLEIMILYFLQFIKVGSVPNYPFSVYIKLVYLPNIDKEYKAQPTVYFVGFQQLSQG